VEEEEESEIETVVITDSIKLLPSAVVKDNSRRDRMKKLPLHSRSTSLPPS
jgi:hypothetical protein